MHMHARVQNQEVIMRTTIEMKDEHRARLLEIAARRGEKGFSKIVEEALDRYLQSEMKKEDSRRRALLVRGILGEKETRELRIRTRSVREYWR